MIRDTFVFRDGKVVLKRLAAPLTVPSRVHVISDTMPPTKHMITGEVLESKSAFRARTRAAGCDEVGNDPAARREMPRPEMPAVEPDIRRAIQELSSR